MSEHLLKEILPTNSSIKRIRPNRMASSPLHTNNSSSKNKTKDWHVDMDVAADVET